MKSSTSIKELAAALALAQAKMPVIPFDSKNPFLKNAYASLGSVIEHSRPILAAHGLAIMQFPVSANGETEKSGMETVADGAPPTAYMTKRRGVESIGVETILLHSSGEWVSETLYVPLTKEKGKSTAQVSGSIISYLRRYAWASVLGLYADQDTDGNEPEDDNRPPARAQPRTTTTSQPPANRPAVTAASATPPATAAPALNPRQQKLATLRKAFNPKFEPFFVFYLSHHGTGANEQDPPILRPGETLEQIRDDWLAHFADNFAAEAPKIDVWLQQNPMPAPTQPAAAGPGKPVEVPRDPGGVNPDEWREFQMPFGQDSGVKMADMDKKKLYGWWANYAVETEYKGKPKDPAKIAADQKLREMLDAAGLHYGFKRG